MSKLKHTPGPWRVVYDRIRCDDKYVTPYGDGSKQNIANVWKFGKVQGDEHNAQLIAAAPEMLDALIEIQKNINSLGLTDLILSHEERILIEINNINIKTIEKATGQKIEDLI